MTKAQTTVIWLGLVMVALNVVVHIADIKRVIFGGPSAPAAKAPANQPLAPGPLSPGNPATTTPPGTLIV